MDNEELAVLELEADHIMALLHTPEEMGALKQVELAAGNPGSGPNGSGGAPKSATLTGDLEKCSKRRGTPFTILNALSATSLRALRYAKEIPLATNIIANDLLPEAVKSIEPNTNHNGIGEIVHSSVDNAGAYMRGKVGNGKQAPLGKSVDIIPMAQQRRSSILLFKHCIIVDYCVWLVRTLVSLR